MAPAYIRICFAVSVFASASSFLEKEVNTPLNWSMAFLTEPIRSLIEMNVPEMARPAVTKRSRPLITPPMASVIAATWWCPVNHVIEFLMNSPRPFRADPAKRAVWSPSALPTAVTPLPIRPGRPPQRSLKLSQPFAICSPMLMLPQNSFSAFPAFQRWVPKLDRAAPALASIAVNDEVSIDLRDEAASVI